MQLTAGVPSARGWCWGWFARTALAPSGSGSTGNPRPAGPLKLGEPKVLFTLRDALYLSPTENYTPYDVGPDGRFIMARVAESSGFRVAPLTVVENWFEEWKGTPRARP